MGSLAAAMYVPGVRAQAALAMLGVAALGMWVVGCARSAAAKGYPEWLGTVLGLLGPLAYLVLTAMPLRLAPERTRVEP